MENRDNTLFKCRGICLDCGRCKDGGMMEDTDRRKTNPLSFPRNFKAKKGGYGFGVAFDVGTTTVVGMLANLHTGELVASMTKTNPQIQFGLDVISRISFAGQAKENMGRLREAIIRCLNDIIKGLCEKEGVHQRFVGEVVLCGNTTMSHIIGGYNPAGLAFSPFKPAYEGTLTFKGETLNLEMAQDGEVIILPNISGHVGGDTTAGILATRFMDKKEPALFMDIGTNGEIAVNDGKRILVCSTAAGPAFEGSAIYQGMRATWGAIEKVRIERNRILFRTIERTEPVGICGSGLIDAVAEMLKAGIIKRTGELVTEKEFEEKNPHSLLGKRLRKRGGIREFVLVLKEDGEDLVITQKDIREVQLAKGVVSAGINTLMEQLNLKKSDLEEIILTGAFGNFINTESAMTIGLIPKAETKNVLSFGNAAGTGAFMILTNRDEGVKVNTIPEVVHHVELAEMKTFQGEFMKAMEF